MVDRGGIIGDIIDSIVDGSVERVGIIIKGVAIIIKGIVVIERVATFPETGLRHFHFFAVVWKVVKSVGVEDSENSGVQRIEGIQRIQRIYSCRWIDVAFPLRV